MTSLVSDLGTQVSSLQKPEKNTSYFIQGYTRNSSIQVPIRFLAQTTRETPLFSLEYICANVRDILVFPYPITHQRPPDPSFRHSSITSI